MYLCHPYFLQNRGSHTYCEKAAGVAAARPLGSTTASTTRLVVRPPVVVVIVECRLEEVDAPYLSAQRG